MLQVCKYLRGKGSTHSLIFIICVVFTVVANKILITAMFSQAVSLRYINDSFMDAFVLIMLIIIIIIIIIIIFVN